MDLRPVSMMRRLRGPDLLAKRYGMEMLEFAGKCVFDLMLGKLQKDSVAFNLPTGVSRQGGPLFYDFPPVRSHFHHG